MAQQYKTGLIITGDASGGIRAIKATESELGKLNQGFDRGGRQSKQFGADAARAGRQLSAIDQGASDASRGLAVLRTNVAGVAAAMATAFGAGSIINQARIIADTDSLAKSIGMATGELQAWDYAAKQAGLAGGQMGDILKDITERIGEFTAEGTGEAAALFENLNLNIEEMKRLAPDQQLLRIADAISTLETRGEKISYLERLGSDATLLLPLLDDNAAKLHEFTNEAEMLGVAMSQMDINNAVEANRAMSHLTGTMDGFTNQIVADLGPGLAMAVGGLADFIQESGGAASILNEVKDVATLTAAVMAGRYAASMVASTRQMIERNAASAAAAAADERSMQMAVRRSAAEVTAAKRTLGRAVAEAQATKGTDSHTAALARLGVARQQAIAATAQHTVAVNANAAATQRATVVARAASGAYALIGGPLGVATLAATAFFMFRDSSDEVASSLVNMDEPLESVIEDFKTLTTESQRAALIKWGDRQEEEADKARQALAKIREEVLSLGFEDSTGAEARVFFDEINAGFEAVESGAQSLDAMLTGLQEQLEIPEGVMRDLRLLASEYSAGRVSADELGVRLAALTNTFNDVSDGAANAGSSVNSNTPSAEALEQWEKYNQKLRDSIAALRDPSALGAVTRDLDSMGITGQFRRSLTLINAMELERLEQQKKNEEEAAAAAKQAASESSRAYEQAARAAEQSAKQQADALRSIQHEMDPLLAEHATYIERMEVLDQALSDNTITQEAYGESVRWAAEQYTRAATGAEEYEKQTESLISTYDRHNQRAHQLRDALEQINQRYRDGEINGDQYARMVGGIRDEMQQLALEAEPISKELARSWEEAANRINETFGDAFTGAYGSFEDFGDRLMDGVKRLLGEIAYQATLEPIVIGFTTDMRGGLGIPGADAQSNGGFDFSNTVGAAKNLYSSASSLLGFGSSAATNGAALSGGFMSAAATQSAGSLYGMAATGGAAQAGLMSSITSGISAAMPWLAGGFAIDNVLGLGITDGITKALGSLFGSDRKSYGQIGSQIGGDDTAGDGVYRYDRNDRSMGWAQDSALGTIGVTKKQKTDDDFLINAVGTLAEVDNLVAGVMTAAQLEKSRTALDGWKSSRTENIAGLADERLSAVLDATGSIFTDVLSQFDGEALVQGLVGGLQVENVGGEMAAAVAADMNAEFREALGSGSDIQAATQSILSSAQAVQTLGGAVDRLGLQFDATAAGALDAAGNLASLVGGTDSLNSLLSGYYDAFYTEQEKFDNLASDLSGTFADMGRELPTTREGVRELVEGLQLMGSAGQEQLATVLQLNQPLSQYITAMEEQRQATLDATTAENELAAARAAERVDLLNRTSLYSSGIVGGVDDALDAYNEQMALASEAARQREQQLRDELNAIQQLGNLLDSLALSDQSILDPAQRLQEAQRQFAELQVRAENGDTEAASQLQGASNAYLTEAANYYGQSSSQYAEIYDDVTSSVRSLEDIFGESVATLGTIESIERQMLREQQRAREMLSSSLSEEVRQSDLLGSIADLIDLLPSSLASAISSILPEFGDNSGGGFDEAAYLANKTAQVNATGQDGRTDWTQQQVLDAIIRDYGSIQAHYAAVGRGEGIQPYYDADTAPASVGGSSGGGGSGSTAFDQAAYLANKTSQVNANGQGGNSSWTQQQVLDAIIRDYGSVEAHYNAIGKSEGVTPYATGAWSIPGDQLALIHDQEMVVPSREGIADEFRAYAAGDYQRELMGELGNIQRALPMPNMPPMPMQSQTNPQADNNAALLRAFAGMRDDNARLLERVGQLEEQLAAIAGNTGALVDPSRRTATAAEETERNSRLKIRNPA
ncbi:hypothetical protein [Vreelandella neptunia]|uniref:Uncharacterized protein n=1 Tax=Vreelandella neptunia TaxID=115551 RepID=A0ABZ0YS96_9GAMM|nr:hypothetical protein [Halomonas neptunia]MDN3561727.1 hypothetical protein [Halomonas neptunia]WQH14628.1 hypothetical protein SR894_08835 [Halomonas neptunia]